jgi:hypothetical protein
VGSRATLDVRAVERAAAVALGAHDDARLGPPYRGAATADHPNPNPAVGPTKLSVEWKGPYVVAEHDSVREHYNFEAAA